MENNSVALIYGIVKDLLSMQQNQKASLENKGSMLMAFAGGMFALLMGAREAILLTPLDSQIFVLVGISLFTISVIIAIIVTWVRSYRIDPNPEVLANEYLNKSPDEIKLQLISNMIGAWRDNSLLIERNANALRLAFLAQALAFISLGTALFLSLF
jgi:hypothetical protein